MDTKFGRMTKEEWSDWVDKMLDKHGEPTKGRPPAQGPPAQGPPPSKLKRKADCCLEFVHDCDNEKFEGVWKELSGEKANNLLSRVICSN